MIRKKRTVEISRSVQPVAILFSDEKPADAKQFKEGKWGCIMFMLVAAVRGSVTAFDVKTYGCQGGGVGLGFGNQYTNFPGGQDCFCHFLSTGNEQWEKGRKVSEQVKPFLRDEAYDDFVKGERYMASPPLCGRLPVHRHLRVPASQVRKPPGGAGP